MIPPKNLAFYLIPYTVIIVLVTVFPLLYFPSP